MYRYLYTMFLGVLCLSAQIATAENIFHFESSPTSWIGQGETLTFTDQNATFSSHRYFNQGVYTNSVKIGAGGYGLRMVGEDRSLPIVGYYGDASRWPFMGNGIGMDFTGPGRGNNTLSGWFDVLQADYNSNGTVYAFAVDFEQFDEQQENRWSRGSIRYNSSIPIPEPTSLLMFVFCGPLLFFALQRSRRPSPKE